MVIIMLYARNSNGERVTAAPKSRAICPICNGEVLAKCGTRKIKHWAHKNKVECDPWSEETPWHNSWKSLVKEDYCEVTISKDGVIHRADIIGNKRTIIELQHSPILPGDIRAREEFYDKMIWVFDAANIFGNMLFKPKNEYTAITWYYSKMTLLYADRPIYFHLPCGNLFQLEKIFPKQKNRPCMGWGRFTSWSSFFNRYLSAVVKYEFSNRVQPDIVKNRSDIEASDVKFHHNLSMHGWYHDFDRNKRIYCHDELFELRARCDCGAKSDFPFCTKIMENADGADYIKKKIG
jgi:hypothetical protein